MASRKENRIFFEEKILDFFQKAGREHLPWRPRKIPKGSRGREVKISPYEVWVSEIMLQQTQVNRVIEYYKRFLKRFPNIQSLAVATWEEFLPYYQGLGYYARGRNMLKAAQALVKEYGGKFPRDPVALQKIPGIGPYTASAIMSFAYGEPHLAWDTNLRRVIGRYFRGAKNLAGAPREWEGTFQIKIQTLNAALMDFGSAICTARPKCGICPLRSQCCYFRQGGTLEKKQERERIEFPLAEARALVFLHANHKIYYGPGKKYAPFLLPASRNSRAGIKDYFLKRYGLILSVRPPHRIIWVKGVPTLLINAQILAGTSTFREFPKTAKGQYLKENKL